MLEPEQKVVVTGEEHHQPALAPWGPHPDGRPRRVAAELGFVPGTRGRQVIEVRIDGRRVGTLTALMSERYGPHVAEVLRRRERPGCVAMVALGRRGLVEVELYLPDVAGIPAPPAGPRRPAPRGPDAGRPPAGPGRRFRTPLLIGGGVFALLLVIGAVSGGGEDRDSGAVPVVAAAAPTSRPAPTTTRVTPTPTPAAQPDPAVDVDRQTTRAPAAAATRESRSADPEPRRAPQPEPQRVIAPAPEPEPERAPDPEPVASGGSTYYANCAAVRAAGADPIRAGDPGYSSQLDRDGDGVGCE
jgi:hypothetical protein